MKGIIPLVRNIDQQNIDLENQYLENLRKCLGDADRNVVIAAENEIEHLLHSLPKARPNLNDRKIYTLNGLVILAAIFDDNIEDAALETYLLRLLNDNVEKLDVDDIIPILHLFVPSSQNYLRNNQKISLADNDERLAQTEKFLLAFFNNYPQLAKTLSPAVLQHYVEVSPDIATKILSQPVLKEKLDAKNGAILEVREKYKNDLAVALYTSSQEINSQLIPQYFVINDSVKAYKNVMDYVKLFAHLRVQFNQDQTITMFAAIRGRSQFIPLFHCLLHTQDNLDSLTIVLSIASQKYDPNNIVKRFSMSAPFDVKAYAKIQYHIYVNQLLLKHEQENGQRYLSTYPTITRAIYKLLPNQFAVSLFSITQLTATDRLRVLNANRSWLELEHLLELNKCMIAVEERKDFFKNGVKDGDKTPADKIREGIKVLLEQDGPLNVSMRELIIIALEKDDLREWIDLAKYPHLIPALLTKTTPITPDAHVYLTPKYDDKVSQIIALDAKLLAAIRGDAKLIKYDTEAYKEFNEQYACRSNFLYAANFVLAHIANSKHWFQSGRNEDFINYFINCFLNAEPKLPTTHSGIFVILTPEKMAAVCWFVANNKDLYALLNAKSIRQKSYFRFIGMGPTDDEIKHDRLKLNAVSEYLKEKDPVVDLSQVIQSINNEDAHALRPPVANCHVAQRTPLTASHAGETTKQVMPATSANLIAQNSTTIPPSALAADMSALQRLQQTTVSNMSDMQSDIVATQMASQAFVPPRAETSHDAQPITSHSINGAIIEHDPAPAAQLNINATEESDKDIPSNGVALSFSATDHNNSQADVAVQAAPMTPPQSFVRRVSARSAISTSDADQNSVNRVARDLRSVFDEVAASNHVVSNNDLPAQNNLPLDATASVSVAPAMSMQSLHAPNPPPPPARSVQAAAAVGNPENIARSSLFAQIQSLKINDDGSVVRQPRQNPANHPISRNQSPAASTPSPSASHSGSLLATMASSSLLANYQPPSPKGNSEILEGEWASSLPATPIKPSTTTQQQLQSTARSAASRSIPANQGVTRSAQENSNNEEVAIGGPIVITVQRSEDASPPAVAAAAADNSGQTSVVAATADNRGQTSAATAATINNGPTNQDLLFSILNKRRSVLITPTASPRKDPNYDSEEGQSPTKTP